MPTRQRSSAWVGSCANIKKLCNHVLSIQVGSEKIKPAKVVWDLGVQLEGDCLRRNTSPRCQWHATASWVGCARYVVVWELKLWYGWCLLVLIMSRIDYCNSLLAGVTHSTLEPLQQVQNVAAHLIHHLAACDHVTLSRVQLHWLPVCWHVHFKLCTIMYTVHRCIWPVYLSEIVHWFTIQTSVWHQSWELNLESASCHMQDPVHGINCHQTFHSASSLADFLKLLKPHFFTIAFSGY